MQAVVLTLSGKNKGICLAVYYPNKNKMYRLVSDGNGGELPIALKDNLNLMDLIEFTPVAWPKNGPQVDNIQIDMNIGIKNLGRYTGTIKDIYNELYRTREVTGKIFGNNSYRLQLADYFKHSLELVKVSNMKILKQISGSKVTGKAEFLCHGLQHKFYSVTDFDYDIRNKSFDCWNIGEAYILVSIPSEPYINNGENKGYYKFISAIYEQ